MGANTSASGPTDTRWIPAAARLGYRLIGRRMYRKQYATLFPGRPIPETLEPARQAVFSQGPALYKGFARHSRGVSTSPVIDQSRYSFTARIFHFLRLRKTLHALSDPWFIISS
jgi:hypothetical protein